MARCQSKDTPMSSETTEAPLARGFPDLSVTHAADTPGVPIAGSRDGSGLTLKLAAIDGTQFVDPFFVDTMTRVVGVAVSEVHFVRPALLATVPPEFRPPAGIILQVSRCGSTLLSNVLRATTDSVVYSEPVAINDVLMPPHTGWDQEALKDALRCVACHLAAAAGNRPYVIKVRSWNTLFAGIIHQAFPDTPWIFLTRDPLEVAVSVLRKPPTWMRAYGTRANPFLAFLPGSAAQSNREAYLAHVLSAFAASVAPLDRRLARLVTYDEIGIETCRDIAGYFGLTLRRDARFAAEAQLRLYSKDPSRSVGFENDCAAKEAEATPALRAAIADIARPVFEALRIQWSRQ